jgi:hypothetical protein
LSPANDSRDIGPLVCSLDAQRTHSACFCVQTPWRVCYSAEYRGYTQWMWMDCLYLARTTFFPSSLVSMLEYVKAGLKDYTNCTAAKFARTG